MIIVSQDKDIVANFDNIEVLGVGNPLENSNGKFAIIADTISDNQYILGEYATEQRAKEVLQEIKLAYTASELLKIPRISPTKPISGDEIAKLISYEMPED